MKQDFVEFTFVHYNSEIYTCEIIPSNFNRWNVSYWWQVQLDYTKSVGLIIEMTSTDYVIYLCTYLLCGSIVLLFKIIHPWWCIVHNYVSTYSSISRNLTINSFFGFHFFFSIFFKMGLKRRIAHYRFTGKTPQKLNEKHLKLSRLLHWAPSHSPWR